MKTSLIAPFPLHTLLVKFLEDSQLVDLFGLTERERDILSKQYSEGLSFNCIASQYNLSTNTIERISQRATEKLVHGFRNAISARQQMLNLLDENGRVREENQMLKERLEVLTPPEKRKLNEVELLRSPIAVLNLDARTNNVFENVHIKTISQLLLYSTDDLRKMRNMGEKSIHKLKDALEELGLELGGG